MYTHTHTHTHTHTQSYIYIHTCTYISQEIQPSISQEILPEIALLEESVRHLREQILSNRRVTAGGERQFEYNEELLYQLAQATSGILFLPHEIIIYICVYINTHVHIHLLNTKRSYCMCVSTCLIR